MWKRKKRPPPQNRLDSLIGAGTLIEGNVTFSGGLRIDGKVHGNVVAASAEPCTLVLGETARVVGEVKATHIVVNGMVHGPLLARDHVELQPKARVVGDVTYRTLEMHVGAVIRGRLIHAEPGMASVVELKRAATE